MGRKNSKDSEGEKMSRGPEEKIANHVSHERFACRIIETKEFSRLNNKKPKTKHQLKIGQQSEWKLNHRRYTDHK